MRTTRHIFAAMICCANVQLWAADQTPLTEVIKESQAVAYVRVTQAAEELHGDVIQHTATLVRCGRAAGLGEQTQIEISWDVPTKAAEQKLENGTPSFSVGEQCIVLLTKQEERWRPILRLNISPEGKFLEKDLGADINLQPGTDADVAVQLIEPHLKKPERRTVQRATPAPPTARNQPWKMMRVSPLRRVWPFFPR